jgi:hypothetical protein
MTAFTSLLSSKVLEQASDSVGQLLLGEYGAIFAAGGEATPPDRIIFKDQTEVSAFQNSVDIGTVEFGQITIELQAIAADALKEAFEAASGEGLSITPRAADSGRRSYDETVGLWRSRVEPALDYWVEQGRLSANEAQRMRALPPFEQVSIVLTLEQKGVYFAKDLSKSIIYSVAPPGASQHLSMLAFDVTEFNHPRVRQILADHYWYQTVISDLPHFTYLGVDERELQARGLKKVEALDREFWLPDID